MDLFQFFARFHVLVLHLPIGILMLSALVELYTRFKSQRRSDLLNVVWFWGGVSAVAACILGWMLSQADGYSADAVFVHRSFGISVAVIAFICWWCFKQEKTRGTILVYGLSSIQLGLLFLTGHYGANMTHGETYLVEYAPNPIRAIAGLPPHSEPRPPITDLKHAEIYLDIVAPMFEKRCASCHNDAKQKGKLNLANLKGIYKGGKSGNTIVQGKPEESELYKRITLDHDEKEFMPAEGKKPLTDEQVAAVKWWISVGAPGQGAATEYVKAKDDKKLLETLLGIEKQALPPIDSITIEQRQLLTDAGFVVKQIAQNANYLDLDMSISPKELSAETLEVLAGVKSHVLYLNLAKKQINKEQLSAIALLPNLQKLRLEHTNVTSSDIEPLKNLANLHYLNLYGTAVDNSVLTILANFSPLQHVYLSGTKIDSAAFENIVSDGEVQMHFIPLAQSKETTEANVNNNTESE